MSQDDADKPTPPDNDTDGSTESAPPADGDAGGGDRQDHGAASGGDDEAPSEAPAAPAEPSLEEQLAASKDATAKMKEKMLRVAADFENFRRRSSREVEEARQRGAQGSIRDLLPVFDNLERATALVGDGTDVESMVKGLEMVHKQFLDVLGKLGIERVAAVGEGFDPNVHESIQYEHSEEHAAGVVMTELQPGYRMGKMLLRPALVVVSRGPAPKEEAAAADASEAADASATGDEAAAGSGTDGTEADRAEAEGAEAEGAEAEGAEARDDAGAAEDDQDG